METVGFVHMADGTAEDYALLDRVQEPYNLAVADRLLVALDGLKASLAGYQVSRYEHSLQSATRALRDGRSEEYVVAALLHDIGDELAPWTHGEMTAAIMKPFIAPDICWVVKHHGLFQMYYYAHYSGGDRNARDRFKDHPCYDATVEFCELYDQNCFDPAFESLPVEEFEPMVQRVFSEPRWLDDSALP
jgi:predicted HD phosphohydrolase